MSSIRENIQKFERDPYLFEELVSEFLLDPKEESASLLSDLILESDILGSKFESLSKVHANLGILYFPPIEKPKSLSRSVGRYVMLAAAALIAFSLSGYLYSTRFSPLPPVQKEEILTFGSCESDGNPESGRIVSGKHSLCEFYFHSDKKGRSFKIRLLPDSVVRVHRDELVWLLDFQSGTILIDSLYSPAYLGRYPTDLKLLARGESLRFLGTKVRVSSDKEDKVKIEVLEGSLAWERKTSEIPVVSGKSVSIPFESESPVDLTPEENQDLIEAFDSVRPYESGSPSAPTNPGKILYPEASEVPGNRILLKNGSVKKGTSLLQKGDIYILIDKDSVTEFKSSEIKRIEFE
ncbi:hypothetical protein CH371_18820 [Leptospira wolffii]|uniref:FecR protein domain-containing protein n=1 Tax=Leptospira wolffii TaxID=409998 RepID=A0A2M9Z7Q0_9LEPT|nr:hypothetical protein [Leptospira wolffii]PJZ64459.1 hypothetical protein CH371_18820 [Leptospira wolffii]